PPPGIPADGMGFEEVDEDARHRREWSAPVRDEVELPGEVKSPDGKRPQLPGRKLSLDAEPGEERDPEAAFHGILEACDAAEFEGNAQAVERSSRPLEALLQGTAGARARFADDERLAGQGVERDGATGCPGVPRGDDEHQGIAADWPRFEAPPFGLLPHEPQRGLALLDLGQHRAAIAHRGPDMDPGMLRVEGSQQGGEEAFAGDRAGGNREVARDDRMEARDVLPGLPVQVEDPPGILVESPARFGEGDPPGPSVEERDSKLFFEDGNSLAHGRLSQAQAARRG